MDPANNDFTPKTVSQWLFWGVCALSVIGILIAFFFLYFNIIYRNHRVIKMSSPNLNILFVLGAITIYVSMVLFGIDGGIELFSSIFPDICKIRLCVISIGFTLVYGSLFTKTWRVYRIFSHTGPKRMVIKDSRLMFIILGLLMVDAVLLTLWLLIDPPMNVLEMEENQTNLTNSSCTDLSASPVVVYSCKSAAYPHLWFVVFAVYKTSILFYGTHLSWATRNVAFSAMNDGRCIIVSVYTCVILVAVSTTILAQFRFMPNVWYACVSLVMFTLATEVICFQYVPKILAWRENIKANFSISRSLTSSFLATIPKQSFAQIEEELFLLSTENASLKKALNEKEQCIRALQRHVCSATDKLNRLVVTPDNKHDSGCDLGDGSSSTTSHEDREPSALDSRDMSPADMTNNKGDLAERYMPHRSSTGDIEKQLPCSLTNITLRDLERQNLKRRKPRDRFSLRSAGSYGSQYSVHQLAELRDSIAKELHTAQNISTNLCEAIASDLHTCRTKPMYYDIARTEESLADILSKTYNLGLRSEINVAATVSSAFIFDNPIFPPTDTPNYHVQKEDVPVEKLSRNSSFRSIASLAESVENKECRTPPNNEDEQLKWPQYVTPDEKQVHEGSPSKTVKSSDMPKTKLNTYV